MSKTLWNSFLLSPLALGATVFLSAAAIATEAQLATESPSQDTAALLQANTSNTTATSESAIASTSPEAVKVARTLSSTPTSSHSQGLPQPDQLAEVTASTLIAQAEEDISSSEDMSQVTSVSQLSDVQPTDWAFQALQSLVERYGCIAGYPDGTYKGNRALTRYEFAAGVNACLDRVNELIAAGTTGLATKEDLATLQKLQEEFAAELATLRGRVDALEARTTELEANQFSTTSKLEGEVVFLLAGIASGENALGEEVDRVPAFGDRARIQFVTSFTGKDTLFTRLQAVGFASLVDQTITPEGNLDIIADDPGNDIELDALWYSFPLTSSTQAVIIANAGAADDIADTVNIFDGDGAFGALSTFGTRPSIYYLLDGTGAGITQTFGNIFELSLGYLAGDAASPTEDNGLFNGRYGALAQLLIKPSDRFKLGLTFIHSYNNQTGTGSLLSNARLFLERTSEQEIIDPTLLIPTTVGDALDALGFSTDIPIVSNAYGIELSWQLADWFVLGGWAGYINTRNVASGNGLFTRGDLDSFNWAVTLGFPDLGKKGSLAGIIVGMEPKVTDSSINVNPAALAQFNALGLPAPAFGDDDSTSLHIEAFYQYQLTDNIAITPGIIWITAPDHNSNNEDLVIGTVRTTFTF
jgi:hypothetical protein